MNRTNKKIYKGGAVFIASLFLFLNISIAQLYNFKKISVEQGLSHPGVYSMCEGPQGKLWIGLEGGGINVFDGWEVSHYSEHDLGRYIRSIYKDSKGQMWFGSSYSGVAVLKGKRVDKITTEDGLFSNHIRGITEDLNGVVWLATLGGGVSVVSEGKVIRNFNKKSGLPSLKCRTILSHSDGSVWVGTDAGVAVIREGKVVRVITKLEGLSHEKILSIAEDRKGFVWLGTQNGISVVNGKEVITVNSKEGLRNSRIKSIVVNDRNVVWVGTRAGLGKIKMLSWEDDSISIDWFDDQNGLSHNRIRSLYLDDSRAIWIGTYFGGVNHLFNESFSMYNKSNGLKDNVITSLGWNVNDSTLWLGTHDYGILIKNNDRIDEINKSVGLSENVITSIAFLKNNKALVGTVEGVNLIENGEVVRVWDQYDGVFKGGQIERLVALNNYCIGLTNQNELFVLEDTGEVFLNKELSFKLNEIPGVKYGIDKVGGEFFIGTDSVLKTIAITENEIEEINRFQLEKVGGVTGGGNQILGYTVSNKLFKIENGAVNWEMELPKSEEVNFIYKSKEQSYWLGLKGRLLHLKFNEGDILDKKFYSINEGFMGGASNRSAIVKDGKGDLYIGTIKGLLRIEEQSYKGVKRDLSVYLEGVLNRNREFDWSKYSDSIINDVPMNLILPYGINHLTFQYKSYHLKNPNEVIYEVDLIGSDEFKFETNKTEVEFVDLSTGEYELQIKARTQWGEWSNKPMVFKFEITPPFWLTKSFIISMSFLVIGLIFMIFKLRTRRLEKEKKRLESLVQERTKALNDEKQKSENLLLNILPVEVAEELKANGVARTRKYKRASVLFTDFKGFTKMSSEMSPELLVKKLDEIFVAFDEVIGRNDLEKIKTIGDAYMCVSGIPHVTPDQAKNAAITGMQLVEVMNDFNAKQRKNNEPEWDVRVGIHTGELIAGVVGKKKFAYDVWGDTVNIASRMESNSEPGRVNISQETFEEIKQYFECEPRGKIIAKNRGELEMYFVSGLKEEFRKHGTSNRPNKEFYKT